MGAARRHKTICPGRMKYRRHDSVSSSASKFPGDEVSRSSYMLRILGFCNTAGDPEPRIRRSFRRICKPIFPFFWREMLSLSYWRASRSTVYFRERLEYHFPGHLLYNFLEKIVLKKKVVSASVTRHAEAWETLEKCLPIVITPFPETNQQNGLVISYPTQSMDSYFQYPSDFFRLYWTHTRKRAEKTRSKNRVEKSYLGISACSCRAVISQDDYMILLE